MAGFEHEITVGDERALRAESVRATVLFGLGPPAGPGATRQRIRRVLTALAPDVRALRWCDQVHGTQIATVRGSINDELACVGRFDGIVTGDIGVGLMVWTADCVPVLLVGPRVVAAVHVGWRGAAAGIVPSAVATILTEFAIPAARLVAFLGPAVSARHYRVGPEVVEALGTHGMPESAWLRGDRVDLRGFLAEQLASLGVRRVDRIGPCTAATPKLASYRRDGDAAGRQWSIIYRPLETAPPTHPVES
jgi:YfiH family protein